MDRLVEFLFEVGMLKRTPRSGWQFLGRGSETVAEHVFRTAVIAWVLARLDGTADADRVLQMALFHDLPETRTGDLNYVNQKYATADEQRAGIDQTADLPFRDCIRELLDEYRAGRTAEAVIAHDADQLEMLLELKGHIDDGSAAAESWVPFVTRRLQTTTARQLAEGILSGDSSSWWFDRDSDWWVRRGRP